VKKIRKYFLESFLIEMNQTGVKKIERGKEKIPSYL